MPLPSLPSLPSLPGKGDKDKGGDSEAPGGDSAPPPPDDKNDEPAILMKKKEPLSKKFENPAKELNFQVRSNHPG